MNNELPRFPECIDCKYRDKANEIGIARDVLASMLLYLHYFENDYSGLQSLFINDLKLDMNEFRHLYDFITSYKNECPIYKNGTTKKNKILVLLMDSNDNDTYQLFQNSLLSQGYQVIFEKDILCAVEIFRQYKEQIKIVIADFNIEHGISFLEDIEKIKPHQPIITLSDTKYCSEPEGCLICKMNHHRIRLLKPVNFEKLLSALHDFESFECESYKKCIPANSDEEAKFLF